MHSVSESREGESSKTSIQHVLLHRLPEFELSKKLQAFSHFSSTSTSKACLQQADREHGQSALSHACAYRIKTQGPNLHTQILCNFCLPSRVTTEGQERMLISADHVSSYCTEGGVGFAESVAGAAVVCLFFDRLVGGLRTKFGRSYLKPLSS